MIDSGCDDGPTIDGVLFHMWSINRSTGFEVKNGRSVPVLEGVVVLQRDEAALLDAYGVR